MRSAVCLASLVLATAGTAAAQPGAAAPAPTAPPGPSAAHVLELGPVEEAAPAPPREPVSETAALWIALGGTLAAWTAVAVGAELAHENNTWAGPVSVVGIGGTLLAPSAGAWYAHSGVSRGLGLRVAGIGLELTGVLLAARCEDECSSSGAMLVAGIALGGLALYAAGTIDDIVTAPGRARRYNQRIQGVTVVPMISRDGPGVALAAQF